MLSLGEKAFKVWVRRPGSVAGQSSELQDVVVYHAHTMTGVHSAPDIKPECVRIVS